MPREVPGWKCTQCHVFNEPTAFQCFRCGRLREGVVVQAVLPDPAGESVTLYEGAAGPQGRVFPHARCSGCDRPLRPDWIACPHCGKPALAPPPSGVKGTMAKFLPWLLPLLMAAAAIAGVMDLFTPQKPDLAGNNPRASANVPGRNTPDANAPFTPEAYAAWAARQGINAPGLNAPGLNPPRTNTPGANPSPTNAPGANAPTANTPGNVPSGPPRANAPAVNAPASPPKPVAVNAPAPQPGGPASATGARVVDPTPASALGSTGVSVQEVTWVTDAGLSEIRGMLRNGSRERYRFVRLTYDLLDQNGASVGTASDSVTNLRRGKSKKFTVLVTNPAAVRCRLKEVQAD